LCQFGICVRTNTNARFSEYLNSVGIVPQTANRDEKMCKDVISELFNNILTKEDKLDV